MLLICNNNQLIFGYHDKGLFVGNTSKFLQCQNFSFYEEGGGVIYLFQADLSMLIYVYI